MYSVRNVSYYSVFRSIIGTCILLMFYALWNKYKSRFACLAVLIYMCIHYIMSLELSLIYIAQN